MDRWKKVVVFLRQLNFFLCGMGKGEEKMYLAMGNIQ
jgi:hypothetical protein